MGNLFTNQNSAKYAKSRGKGGEFFAIYNAQMNGYYCALELSDNAPYDIIVCNGNGKYSVQIKAGSNCRWKDGGGVTFNLVQRNSNGNNKYSFVDLFALVDLKHDMVAWRSWEQIGHQSKETIKFNEFQHHTLAKLIGDPPRHEGLFSDLLYNINGQQSLKLKAVSWVERSPIGIGFAQKDRK